MNTKADRRKIARKIYRFILYMLPRKTAHELKYYKIKKRRLNLINPKTYDECIHWLIVNAYDESYGKYADKLEVREYVRACGYENILVPLLGVYENAEDIDFASLPNKFVLKTNHGSGKDFYSVCSDKKQIDERDIILKLKKALKCNFAMNECEYHYKKIKPVIICEKYLESQDSDKLTDYKIVCHYGKPKAILVCSDRDEGRDYFSPEWEYLEYTKPECRYKGEIRKPQNLDEMLLAAEKLAKPFPLARIDFYSIDNQLYFGEITLTPGSGFHANLTAYGQEQLVKGLKLIK